MNEAALFALCNVGAELSIRTNSGQMSVLLSRKSIGVPIRNSWEKAGRRKATADEVHQGLVTAKDDIVGERRQKKR